MSERRARLIALNNAGSAALRRGWLEKAAALYQEAIASLTWEEDDVAAALYENLGLVYVNQGRARRAVEALERSLDGAPRSRPQALRYVVGCLAQDQRYATARRRLEAYIEAFGPHPDGWTVERLEALGEAHRARLARSIAVS